MTENRKEAKRTEHAFVSALKETSGPKPKRRLAFHQYDGGDNARIQDVQHKTYNCSSGSPELESRLPVVSSEQTQDKDHRRISGQTEASAARLTTPTYRGRVGDVYVDVTRFEGKLRKCGAIESERTGLTAQRNISFGELANIKLQGRAHVQTWEVSSDDLLHRRDDSLPGPKVVLGDAVLPHCSMDGDVQGSQVGSRGRWQRPQLVLLLLFLIHQNTSNSQSGK